MELARQIVAEGDLDRAQVFHEVYCCIPECCCEVDDGTAEEPGGEDRPTDPNRPPQDPNGTQGRGNGDA